MGFTIEDMRTVAEKQYKMKLIAGKGGWSNSIRWIMMAEDFTILEFCSGKELIVTTCLGFDTKEKILKLAQIAHEKNAAGLIINYGNYIKEIPQEIITYCDTYNLPLMTIPWEIQMVHFMQDLTTRIFLQDVADEQLSNAFVQALKHPDDRDRYENDLARHFDLDGSFQVMVLTTEALASMDTVERRRIGFAFAIYLENVTHNAHFFYYDTSFVLILNDLDEHFAINLSEVFLKRCEQRMPDQTVRVGIGSRVTGIRNLQTSYRRAIAAAKMAHQEEESMTCFDDMDVYRILYSVRDQVLLKELVQETIGPLLEYDEKHDTNYVETLDCYLQANGSIKEVAEKMFTHRNTVIYRINNIKKILNCELGTVREREPYIVANLILKMQL